MYSLKLIKYSLSHVYTAELRKTIHYFENTMIKVARFAVRWNWMKEEIIEQQRHQNLFIINPK